MDFQGTPLNMTTLLVVALAVVAIVFLLRKRYDSNLLLRRPGVYEPLG